ncbi:hypothetical protein INT45_004231 [Circinella minor]|uniref:Uncharacterized protein n=1 Tax=Circinella minor TaxID=1195481 RepID=A0A8H7RTR8_9FUNG|nr:hypothetical protein INT45_004231 [Circinella minor]
MVLPQQQPQQPQQPQQLQEQQQLGQVNLQLEVLRNIFSKKVERFPPIPLKPFTIPSDNVIAAPRNVKGNAIMHTKKHIIVHFVSAVMNFRESEELEQVESIMRHFTLQAKNRYKGYLQVAYDNYEDPSGKKGLGTMGDMDILAKDFGIFVKENIQGIPIDICEDNWVANYFLKTLGYTITHPKGKESTKDTTGSVNQAMSLMGASSVLSVIFGYLNKSTCDSDAGPFVGESVLGSSSTAIDPVFSIPPVPAFSIPALRNPLATTTTTTTMPPTASTTVTTSTTASTSTSSLTIVPPTPVPYYNDPSFSMHPPSYNQYFPTQPVLSSNTQALSSYNPPSTPALTPVNTHDHSIPSPLPTTPRRRVASITSPNSSSITNNPRARRVKPKRPSSNR